MALALQPPHDCTAVQLCLLACENGSQKQLAVQSVMTQHLDLKAGSSGWWQTCKCTHTASELSYTWLHCSVRSLFQRSTSNLLPQSEHSTTGLKMHEIIPMSSRVEWREIMLSTLTLFSELLASPSPLQRAPVFNIVWDYLISSLGLLPDYCPRTERVSHRPPSRFQSQTNSSCSPTAFILHYLLCYMHNTASTKNSFITIPKQ